MKVTWRRLADPESPPCSERGSTSLKVTWTRLSDPVVLARSEDGSIRIRVPQKRLTETSLLGCSEEDAQDFVSLPAAARDALHIYSTGGALGRAVPGDASANDAALEALLEDRARRAPPSEHGDTVPAPKPSARRIPPSDSRNTDHTPLYRAMAVPWPGCGR